LCIDGYDCELTVTRSLFTGNSGSGISAGDSAGLSISVTHSTFRCNTAANGGAIYFNSYPDGNLAATDDVFTDNSAAVAGGGIYNGEAATVTDDTFTGNSATMGGAIENGWYLTVTNTTFRRNKASADGGAIYDFVPVGRPTQAIAGGRITGNSAGGDGGGIYYSGPPGGISVAPSTTVRNNQPDNCAPLGSVEGCTG
jgi:predicted outer membrane repeat protein